MLQTNINQRSDKVMESIKDTNRLFKAIQEGETSNCCDASISLSGFCMDCKDHTEPYKEYEDIA